MLKAYIQLEGETIQYGPLHVRHDRSELPENDLLLQTDKAHIEDLLDRLYDGDYTIFFEE